MIQTDWRVWRDTRVAAHYVVKRRNEFLDGGVPQEILLYLLRAAGLNPDSEGRVLDIGCGGGALLEVALTAFPRLSGVGLDGSPEMLRQTRVNLAKFGDVQFVEADFNAPTWRDGLPEGPAGKYAAIISGYAIHHSEDSRKRELYAEIFDLLEPGGVFVNVEHVASASPLGETLFETAWVEHTVRLRRERGEEADFNTVNAEFAARPDKSANRLTPVETQLRWLREIGFADVDCYWKHFELAVLAGYRSIKHEVGLLDWIEKEIEARQPKDFRLQVVRTMVRKEGDWSYIVVKADRIVDASRYNAIVQEVEDVLFDERGENVSLISAMVDD